MITAAMLKTIEEAGEGVLVLVDGLEADDFERSRLTRHEVRRQLLLMADTLALLPEPARQAMPEIDWAGWRAAAVGLHPTAPGQGDVAWFAARSLVPATLSWLRVYRGAQPGLFDFTA